MIVWPIGRWTCHCRRLFLENVRLCDRRFGCVLRWTTAVASTRGRTHTRSVFHNGLWCFRWTRFGYVLALSRRHVAMLMLMMKVRWACHGVAPSSIVRDGSVFTARVVVWRATIIIICLQYPMPMLTNKNGKLKRMSNTTPYWVVISDVPAVGVVIHQLFQAVIQFRCPMHHNRLPMRHPFAWVVVCCIVLR